MKAIERTVVLAALSLAACSGGLAPSFATVDGSADAAVPAGEWSCLPGTAHALTALPQTVARPAISQPGHVFSVRIREAYTGNLVAGVDVAACEALDPDCTPSSSTTWPGPLAQATTSEEGIASLVLPDAAGPVPGFLRVSGAMPTNDVFLEGRPLAYGRGVVNEITVYTTPALGLTAGQTGARLDPGLGVVRIDALDCAAAPASGVSVRAVPAVGAPVTEYFIDGGATLSKAARVTDTTGVGFVFGVSEGPFAVTETLDGRPVGSTLAFAHPGTVTSVVVKP